MNPTPTDPQRARAIRMLLLASLYWGVSFPVIKALMMVTRDHVPGAGNWFLASAAAAPRYLLAAIVMVALAGRRGLRATRGELVQGAAAGGFSALGSLLQTDALQFTEASTSAFLTQLSAIIVPTWVALRHRRNPGLVVWACCGLVLAGVAVLGHLDVHHLRPGRGEWETLLCSVFYTGQILWIEKREFAANRPDTVTGIMFAVQAAAFTALAAATAPSAGALLVPWSLPSWLGLTALLTVVCTVGAFSIMTRWQPHITSTQAGLIYCTEPVFASLFCLFVPGIISATSGLVYLNESATWSLVAGGLMVTAANVIVQVRASRLLASIVP